MNKGEWDYTKQPNFIYISDRIGSLNNSMNYLGMSKVHQEYVWQYCGFYGYNIETVMTDWVVRACLNIQYMLELEKVMVHK